MEHRLLASEIVLSFFLYLMFYYEINTIMYNVFATTGSFVHDVNMETVTSPVFSYCQNKLNSKTKQTDKTQSL